MAETMAATTKIMPTVGQKRSLDDDNMPPKTRNTVPVRRPVRQVDLVKQLYLQSVLDLCGECTIRKRGLICDLNVHNLIYEYWKPDQYQYLVAFAPSCSKDWNTETIFGQWPTF